MYQFVVNNGLYHLIECMLKGFFASLQNKRTLSLCFKQCKKFELDKKFLSGCHLNNLAKESLVVGKNNLAKESLVVSKNNLAKEKTYFLPETQRTH